MVIDSSVVIAIILGEPGNELFKEILGRNSYKLMSIASVLECTVVNDAKVNRLRCSSR